MEKQKKQAKDLEEKAVETNGDENNTTGEDSGNRKDVDVNSSEDVRTGAETVDVDGEEKNPTSINVKKRNRKHQELMLAAAAIIIGLGVVAGTGYWIGSHSTKQTYEPQVQAGYAINTDMNSEMERLKEKVKDYQAEIKELEQQLDQRESISEEEQGNTENQVSDGTEADAEESPEMTVTSSPVPTEAPVSPTATPQTNQTEDAIPAGSETVYDPDTLSVNEIPNSLLSYLGDGEELRKELYDYLQRQGYKDVTSCTIGYEYTYDAQSGIVDFSITLDNSNHTVLVGEYNPRYGSYSFSQ